MFTGLIEELGTVERIDEEALGRRIAVRASDIMSDTKIDDSISINGICLTVIDRRPGGFVVQAVQETVRKTTAGDWRLGTRVNLERALRADSRLGGHFVQGHVDDVVEVISVQRLPQDWLMTVRIGPSWSKYIIVHGSLALDGVSLTVARWQAPVATVSLIPHTLQHTSLGDRRPGDKLNLEVDILGKYVESLLAPARGPAMLDEQSLQTMGYTTRDRQKSP